jgi:hypothetical protein
MSTSEITFDEAVAHRDRQLELDTLAHTIAATLADTPHHVALPKLAAKYKRLRALHDEFQARLEAR